MGTEMKKDCGKMLLSPRAIDQVKNYKDGREVVIYHQTGSAFSTEEGSPIHDASIYIMATAVYGKDGQLVDHARLIQFMAADGSIAWAYSIKKEGTAEGEYVWTLKSGMGAFKNIRGTITEKGFEGAPRVDCHEVIKLCCEFYTVDAKDPDPYYGHKDEFQNHDAGYSFHGAHAFDQIMPMTNGYNIVINNQHGHIISEVVDSPRHHATCCDRGYMIRQGENTLGDVMLLEDTDIEGNMIWIYHEWWYDEGPGDYELMGGHGKWAGITGVGTSTGQIADRQDEHFMPTWALSWNI